MKIWLHKARCWIDDRAHMILYSLGAMLEGLDLTPIAIPMQNVFPKYGQQIYSGTVMLIFLVGIWRAKVTHARGKELKTEIHELKQQVVDATGQMPVMKEPNGSL